MERHAAIGGPEVIPDIKSPIRTFDPVHLCEQCAVREYKEKHPLTWCFARSIATIGAHQCA